MNVDSASGEPKPKPKGLLGTVLQFLWIVSSMRIDGKYSRAQFFDDSGNLILSPTVLITGKLKQLKDIL